MVSPADRRRKARAASILDFKPRLGNHCRFLPGNDLQHAVILDFEPRLANRCKLLPGNDLQRAVILDFKPRLGNRCMVLPGNDLGSAVILDLRWSIWESLQGFPRLSPFACSDSGFQAQTCESLQRLVEATKNGPPAAPSLRQVRIARLQNDHGGRRRGQDATKAA